MDRKVVFGEERKAKFELKLVYLYLSLLDFFFMCSPIFIHFILSYGA